MHDRIFRNILIVLVIGVVSFVLGKLISHGSAMMSLLPVVAGIGLFVCLRYKKWFPAIVMGMSWYGGGSPFINAPYVTLILTVSCGLAVLDFFLTRQRVGTEYTLPPEIILGVLCLFGIAFIICWNTFMKMKGLYSVATYGVPGGQRFSLTAILYGLFSLLLLKGLLADKCFHFIPVVALTVALFGAVLDTINFISPQSAFITYYLSTQVNFEVIDTLRGVRESVFRIAGLRELGLFWVIFIFCRFVEKNNSEMKSSITPKMLLGIGIALVIILFSGFRNYLVRVSVVCAITFWFYDRKWFWSAIAIGGVFWLGAIAAGNSIEHLPASVHRVLGSLPGVFKSTEALSALDGIDWRTDLFQRFVDNEFYKHPWFGRGQVGKEFILNQTLTRDKSLFFELTQMYHSGLASALDVVGIIGTLGLMVAQFIALGCSFKMLGRYRNQLEGWMLWMILYFCQLVSVFWYTGFFSRHLPMLWLSIFGVYLAYLKLMQNGQQNHA